MNKQTIPQVEARRTLLLRRLRRTVNELCELESKLKKMRTGRLRVPAPPGVRVKIESNPNGLTADTFGDVILGAQPA